MEPYSTTRTYCMSQSHLVTHGRSRTRVSDCRARLLRWPLCFLAPWLSLGCVDTPLDATLLEADDGTISVVVPSCVTTDPAVGTTYTIVSKPTGRCLGSGELTEIEPSATGATGFTVRLVSCADLPNQHWELIGDSTEWQIQNVGMGLNLDLEGGSFYDGTEALLYTAHGRANQLFWFNPLADESVEIHTALTDNGCLQAMVTGENAVELQGCPNLASTIVPYQNWYLSEVDCSQP